MDEIFKNLEKIISNDIKNEDINFLIQDDSDLFNYSNIKEIRQVFKIYKEILKLYKKSKLWLNSNISYINVLMEMMQNKKNIEKKSENIYGDLFLEIESMLSFFQLSFKPNYELVWQFEYEYHLKNSIFLYIFSIFDKLSTLLFFHYYSKDKNYNEEEISEVTLRNIKFSISKSYLVIQDKVKNSILKKEIDSIICSNCFKYLLKIRNITYHRFKDPMLKYHFTINIMICFITLLKLIDIIKNNIIL